MVHRDRLRPVPCSSQPKHAKNFASCACVPSFERDRPRSAPCRVDTRQKGGPPRGRSIIRAPEQSRRPLLRFLCWSREPVPFINILYVSLAPQSWYGGEKVEGWRTNLACVTSCVWSSGVVRLVRVVEGAVRVVQRSHGRQELQRALLHHLRSGYLKQRHTLNEVIRVGSKQMPIGAPVTRRDNRGLERSTGVTTAA